RTSPAMLIALADAVVHCDVAEDLLDTSEVFAPLEVNCPTHVVWAARDRIFPVRPFADAARERVPGARHSVLDDVGHVPMLDNSELVARTSLEQVARARAAS